MEISDFLVHIISPSYIHTCQAFYCYFYFFLQEFRGLLSFIYLRHASPWRMFSRLIPAPVIAHCTAFQNLLSITYSFPIGSNLSTLVSHCQHLQFRSPSHLLYLITQSLRHISAHIFLCYFAFFAYCLLLYWISVLSICCILLSELTLAFYSCSMAFNCSLF